MQAGDPLISSSEDEGDVVVASGRWEGRMRDGGASQRRERGGGVVRDSAWQDRETRRMVSGDLSRQYWSWEPGPVGWRAGVLLTVCPAQRMIYAVSALTLVTVIVIAAATGG